MQSTTNKDAKQKNECSKTKERKLLPASEQDGERMGLDHKDDSSPESGDENKLDSNINHSERANAKVLSFVEDLEEYHSTQPEEINEPGAVMEIGIATNCKANIEGPGVSCKVGT